MKLLKKSIVRVAVLGVSLNLSTHAAFPVVDGVSIGIDIADNVKDIITTAQDLSHQVEQINSLKEQISQMDEQITQMDTYMEHFGISSEYGVDTKPFSTDDLLSILDEISNYKNGGGLTNSDIEENETLFGSINKTAHTLDRPAAEEEYTQYEEVEIEYAAYKKTSDSVSIKRLELLDHHHALTLQLSAAQTDQETSKINSALKANATALAGLKAEEERQYRSYQAALARLENQERKEAKRQSLRKEHNNKKVWQKRPTQSDKNYKNVVVNEDLLK